MKLIEIYVDEPRYNDVIDAAMPGWRVAEYDNGVIQSICPEYEAEDAAEAESILRRILAQSN